MIAATPSSLLARQAFLMDRKLMRLITAIMMIAARTGLGRWKSRDVKKSSVSSTKTAEIIDDSGVLASDARFSADLENEPLTGMDWQNAAATLANPCPISSLFSSQGWRVLMAITLQLDIASIKLIKAITKPAGKKIGRA